jgi:hypothetical protein
MSCALSDSEGALVWTMASAKDRFTGSFNTGRTIITAQSQPCLTATSIASARLRAPSF